MPRLNESSMNPPEVPSWLSREKQESSERREGVERLAEKLKSNRSLLLWTAIEVMVGLGTLYLVFFKLPAIFSPSPQIATNFTYPFSTQFTFFNEGYFSAHEVRSACQLNSVLSASKTVKHVPSPISMKTVPKIRPRDSLTIPCVLPIRVGPIKFADVTLILTYRGWGFSLWDTEQRFRYNLERLPTGEAKWLRQSAN
jgi:hypothetical protein